MLFKQGKIIAQQSGAMPAASFNQWLESHIAEI
jgi:thioredoxin 2